MKLENYDMVVRLKSRIDQVDRLLEKYDSTQQFIIEVQSDSGAYYCIECIKTVEGNDYSVLAKDFVDCLVKQLRQERGILMAELETL